MTPDHVAGIAAVYRADSVNPPRQGGPNGTREMVVIEGSTQTILGFLDSKLRFGHYMWLSGLWMRYSRSMTFDYCAGQPVVEVTVDLSESIGTVELLLDSESLGTLSWPYSRSFYVPLGPHEIALQQGNMTTVRNVTYTASGPTQDRLIFDSLTSSAGDA